MKFPPYPQYKQSGVEWLGEVPTHWDITRLKFIAQRMDYKVEANEEILLPYIGLENIESWTGKLLPLDADLIPTGISNRFSRRNTLFGKLRPYLAKACNPDLDGLCSSELLVLEVGNHDRRYLLYQLLTEGFVSLVDSSTYGAKMPRASWDFIGTCAVPHPPVDEQRLIADYLDETTNRIDMLLAKKRDLIRRLKEKSTALISQTISCGLPPTRAREAGLEPHPKLRTSGVKWLGDVPQHWEVAEFRRFTSLITSGSRGWAEYYSDEGEIFVRIGNLTRDSIRLNLSDIQRVNPPEGAEGERTRIRPGDLLFSITAYMGSVAVATADIAAAYINQHIALLRLEQTKLIPEFAAFATLSHSGQAQLSALAYGGTKVQLSLDDVKSIWLPVPPLPEQRAIANFLENETTKIDGMIAKIEAAIERLKEYRIALITAAVTGKIDIRGASA
jgi:type I restriction enzyme S subunit